MTGYVDSELSGKIMKTVQESPIPVSIDYVRHNCGTTWPTARAVLLALALEGKIKAVRSTAGWIFFTGEAQARALQVKQ